VRVRRIILFLICFVTVVSFASIPFPAAAKSEDSDLSSSLDFGFAIPDGWTVSAPAGGPVAGNLSLTDSCSRISLNWSRDPGMNLREILNQIKGAYDGNGVRIISSELGERSSEGRRVETLHLIYEFNGYRNEKRFAIWNSSRSDRLFLASLSSCGKNDTEDKDNKNNKNNSNNNVALFDEFVASFSDLATEQQAKISRKTPVGAWPVVLGDLLSSYHYKDVKILQGQLVRVLVMHSLAPQNGIYILDSKATFRVEPPIDAAARAGAVQDILQHAGYEAWIMQKGGKVAVAIRDPTGGWQKVSVKPAHSERMVGVLANGTEEALLYPNLAKMAAANGITGGIDQENIVEKDCEPSKYVELKAPTEADQSWMDNLKDVLDSYEYDKNYQEKVFDCSDTSQISWRLLKDKGYDARLMMSYAGHPLDPHMWVVVKYPDEADRFVAVETANTDSSKKLVHLGKIVNDSDYFRGIMYNTSVQFSRLHPEEGIIFEN
jgi:hypothetical protein